MTFVPRLGGNIITCSSDMDDRIICTCPINRDVSAGPEPRNVVPCDIQLCMPE